MFTTTTLASIQSWSGSWFGLNLDRFRGTFSFSRDASTGGRSLHCIAPFVADHCNDGDAIVFSLPGRAPCYVQFIVADNDARKRAPPTIITLPASSLLPIVSSLVGDPHISGPNGERFDFKGQSGAFYSLFSSRNVREWLFLLPLLNSAPFFSQFYVNGEMALHQKASAGHFLSKVSVTLCGETIDVAQVLSSHDIAHAVANADQRIAPLGGRVLFERHNELHRLVVEFCDGERVSIAKHVPSNAARVAFELGPHDVYYNVQFDIPHCREDFGGLIGHMYQCKSVFCCFCFSQFCSRHVLRVFVDLQMAMINLCGMTTWKSQFNCVR